MKYILLLLSCCMPLLVLGQMDSTTLVVMRNTGLFKGAAVATLDLGEGRVYRLSKKDLVVAKPISNPQSVAIRMEGKERHFSFRIPEQDTLFLEVQIHSTAGGALPSSRFRPGLAIVPRRQAQAMMRERWARKTMAADR